MVVVEGVVSKMVTALSAPLLLLLCYDGRVDSTGTDCAYDISPLVGKLITVEELCSVVTGRPVITGWLDLYDVMEGLYGYIVGYDNQMLRSLHLTKPRSLALCW